MELVVNSFQLYPFKMYLIYMNYIFKIIFIIVINLGLFASNPKAGSFSITRLQYSGGGDWYSDPSSISNLLKFISKNTNIEVNKNENRAKIGSDEFYNSYFLYLTGHGNINFSDKEAQELRNFLCDRKYDLSCDADLSCTFDYIKHIKWHWDLTEH